MTSFRVLMLFATVHLAALAFGAWVVMGSEAALILAWVTVGLIALSIPLDAQIILRPLFALIYRRWMWDHWSKNYYKVVRVTSWRGALLESRNGRERKHMTACFWGLE